ncbi:MAG TPA: Ig-like domain-containing protein [Candidatus Goldiibacteriota bacterium]|nr:Ig-like domain-containing protein [Candidatus Goldiibacteriota bacterium]
MKKYVILSAVLFALATASIGAGLDHFVVTFSDNNPINAGGQKQVSVFAYESSDNTQLKTDYAGPAYLYITGGGQVEVISTGTNATGSFSGGSWTGNVKIYRAGAAITVEARDLTVTSAVGTSPAIVVNAGPYTKIKMIVEDMFFAPGTIEGHAGNWTTHTTQTDFPVTVYTCDDYYNPVVPSSATGIMIDKVYIGSITTDPPGENDLFAASASSITFTAAIFPTDNATKSYIIRARDTSRGFSNDLEMFFVSLTDLYFWAEAPGYVTAGVPFRVTVTVSHFLPRDGAPDTSFAEAVRIKAVKTSDATDAVPGLTDSALIPYTEPPISACTAGKAYFDVALTKTTGTNNTVRIKPIQAGVEPIVNVDDPLSFTAAIIVGAGTPVTFTVSATSERLERGKTALITARPYDTFGNPVTGTAVNMTITAGSGTLSANSVLTDGSGIASVTYTAPSSNSENTISISCQPVAAPLTVKIISELTEKFENWPNPFIAGKESTKINYSLPEDSEVKLRLYSVFGKLVWSKDVAKGEIVNGENHGKKGGNTIVWDGKTDKGSIVGAGVYILKVTITNSTGTETRTVNIAVGK